MLARQRLISRPGVRSRPLTPVCVAGHCFGRQPGVQLRVHAAAAGFERQAASAAYSRRAHRRCVYWQRRIDAHRMRSTHPAVPERVRGMAMNQSLGDDRAARPLLISAPCATGYPRFWDGTLSAHHTTRCVTRQHCHAKCALMWTHIGFQRFVSPLFV